MGVESGYFKKHLQVDLSSGAIQTSRLSDEFIEQFVGGRGFGAKLVWDNLVGHDFEVDPLGPNNLMVMAPGPLTYGITVLCVTSRRLAWWPACFVSHVFIVQ